MSAPTVMSRDPGWKVDPLTSGHGTCACCPPRAVKLDLRRSLLIGFGMFIVTRDGEHIVGWMDRDHKRGADAEAIAKADPDHDWRLTVDGPMTRYVYQRHGVRRWVLVEKGRGFA